MKTIFLSVISFIVILKGLWPDPVLAQPIQNLHAQIISVEVDSRQEEVSRVLGTASGQDFSRFSLEFGVGEFPETWKVLAQSSQSVNNGLLAVWKTASLPSETYTLRLTVKDRSGESLTDRMVIKLHERRPDLSISSLEAKVQGTQVTLIGAVENRSRHLTQKPITVDFYLSLNSTLDPSAIRLGSSQWPGIEAGGSLPIETRIAIPSQVKDGSYTLLARIDPKDEVVEADEENNVLTARDPIHLAPDLVVSELHAVLVKGGQQIAMNGKIRNQGNRPAARPFTLVLFLSSDGSIDGRDLRVAVERVEHLGPDASTSFRLNSPLPESLESGNYFVLAQLDPDGKIAERDKSNNVYWGSNLTLGPDLAVTALSATLSRDGKQIVITDSVKNAGRYPVRQPFRIRYDLVPHTVGLSSNQVLGSREVPSLSSQATSSASTSFPTSSLAKGIYTVLARVDIDKTILDMNRNNNEFRSGEIKIGPDLLMDALTTTLLPNGEQLEVEDRVKNQGSLPVAREFQVVFYLSSDRLADPSDRVLGSRTINGLEVGMESRGKTVVTLPPKAEPAEVFVWGRVDPEGIVEETDTQNNTATAGRLLKTDVDLVISQFTATLTSRGDQLVLMDTVKNLGPDEVSRPFTIAFYLSQDGGIGSKDLFLGDRRVEGLKAGSTSSGTTTLAIPDQAGVGKISVLARVDAQNQVMERKETNNDYWGSSLHLGPDLLLSDLKGEIASDGHEITVVQVVKNQGNRATPAGFKGAAYLSTDPTIGPDDLLLGDLEIGPLISGDEATAQKGFAIPPSLPSGEYILLGRVDPKQEIAEVEETNNDRSGGKFSLGPDLVVETIKATLSPEGDNITVEASVRNQGNRPTEGSLEVSYYLSRNWSVDDTDIFLGARTINRLGHGEVTRASTVFPLVKKKVPTGRYFVLGRVDSANAVVETDESNNVRPTLMPLIIRQEK